MNIFPSEIKVVDEGLYWAIVLSEFVEVNYGNPHTHSPSHLCFCFKQIERVLLKMSDTIITSCNSRCLTSNNATCSASSFPSLL